jgi:hypothetical protein
MRPLALLLLSISVGAQTPKLEFDVASIKPAPERPHPGLLIVCRGGPGTSDPSRADSAERPAANKLFGGRRPKNFGVSCRLVSKGQNSAKPKVGGPRRVFFLAHS